MANPPMRIDLVISELFVGGAERCLTELAIGLKRGGDQVRVASIAHLPGEPHAGLVHRLRDEGISVDSAGCDRPRGAVSAFLWLRRWFQQGRPDVVQTMLYHANVLGTFAARSAGVPMCVGGMRVAEKIGGRLLLERQAVKRMDALVCVSGSVRGFAEAVFGTALPKTVVIGNSVDVDAVARVRPVDWRSFGWPADADVLLFVGRLHPQKGLDVLVEAIEPLLERLPTMRVLLVGEGPQREMLESVARRLGQSRFQLAGWRPDSLAMIQACRLLVLPSRYEGMPNVILEAMAAGKPVAASRVEGVEELLGDASDGQTCRPDDPAALRELIQRLWLDRPLADGFGRSNLQRAVGGRSPEEAAAAYRQLYGSLV
jgi:glycosyltransferase involved in cell wall biosynthesis